MTSLSANTTRAYGTGFLNHHPVIASDIIYAGAAVGDNGSGYARPLVGGDPFLGFAESKADNASGSAGDINVEVRREGIVKNLPVTGVVITSIGAPVHASDDNAFTLTPGSTTQIGIVVRYVANGYADVLFWSATSDMAQLTDNSTGTASDTIAAMTNLDTLTDSTSGTADDTVDDVSTAVTGVDGTGSNAASKADVDTRLGAINNNFKELVDQVVSQKTLNTALINAVASLAAKVNLLAAGNNN